MTKRFWWRLCLLSLGLFGMGCPTWAQTGFFQEESVDFEGELLSGFSEDGRVKILLLTLMPSGMTETAAEEISNALQKNLFNTNHFTVVSPSEWNAQIKVRNPSLADCHDIACGIAVGRLFSADKVMVGAISTRSVLNEEGEAVEGMVLSLRIVDVMTNITSFTDDVQFTDADMHDALFKLAVNISENTLLQGHVLSADETKVSINLGLAHGMKVGHQVVIYTQSSATADLEGQTLGLSRKSVAIVQVHRVNEMSSDGIIVQQFEPVSAGYLVKTYVNFSKQIHLVSETRREMDTQMRLRPRTRPLELTPELVEDNSDRLRWKRRLSDAESEHDRWMYATIGSGIVTILILDKRLNVGFLGDEVQRLFPFIAGGLMIYSGMKFIHYRQEIEELMAEGRVKGYVSNWNYQWGLTPEGGLQMAFHLKF